jgi:hypothetical protein
MSRRLAWLLAGALAFAGCGDRTAGTETGNPEITVVADFMVFDYMTSETLALNFRVMGMGYSIARPDGAPDSGKCWARPGGTLVDFAIGDSFALPDTSIEDDGTWPQAEIILRTPDGPAWIPDLPDIGTWSNPRYAKFNLNLSGRLRPALFEMPQGAEFRLLYDEESTESWRLEDKLRIPFFFNSAHFFNSPASLRGLRTRLDGKGVQYVLLSPTENAAAWDVLKARLPECFYADSVIVR